MGAERSGVKPLASEDWRHSETRGILTVFLHDELVLLDTDRAQPRTYNVVV